MKNITNWIKNNSLASILILSGVVLLIVMIVFGKLGYGIGGLITVVIGWLNKKEERKIEKLQKDRKIISQKIQESKDRQGIIIANLKDSSKKKKVVDEKIANIQKKRDALINMSDKEYIEFLKTL